MQVLTPQNFHLVLTQGGVGFEDLGDAISHQAAWKESVVDVYKKALKRRFNELRSTCQQVELSL